MTRNQGIGTRSMRITDWPKDERPRERLLKHGAAALSEAELLAIFLRTGIAGKSAVELGRELIARFGSLHRLFAATLEEVAAIAGLGPAKYAQLKDRKSTRLNSSHTVISYAVFCLKKKNRRLA